MSLLIDKIKAGLVTLLENSLFDYMENDKEPGEGQRLAGYLRRDKEAVLAQVAKYFDVCDPGPIATKDDADKAARQFKAEGVQLLLVVSLFWSSDKPLLKLLRIMEGLPIIYWCYTPDTRLPDHMRMPDLYRRSGAVGALQNCAPLKKMGIKFAFVFGTPDTPELNKEMEEYARAFGTLVRMNGLRVGQLCGRFEEMTGTYVDEFRLLSKFGADMVHITPGTLRKTAEALTDDDIRARMEELKRFYAVRGVSDNGLYHAVRVSMAVTRVAIDENLGVVAVQDFNDEMHEYFKTRPQIWMPELREHGKVVSMEADAICGLCMWISRQLGGTTPMYTEIFTFDQERNGLLFGHASMMDTELAGDNPITIIPDAELGMLNKTEGAWLHFAAKPGHVVVNSLFSDNDGYTATMFEGEAETTQLLDIHPNAFVTVKTPIRELYRRLMKHGMTQHFSLSYDDIAEKWRKFCEITDIPLEELE